MQFLRRWIIDFVRREDGPTAVEYAVMLALIMVATVGAVTSLGSNSNKSYNSARTGLTGS